MQIRVKCTALGHMRVSLQGMACMVHQSLPLEASRSACLPACHQRDASKQRFCQQLNGTNSA